MSVLSPLMMLKDKNYIELNLMRMVKEFTDIINLIRMAIKSIENVEMLQLMIRVT